MKTPVLWLCGPPGAGKSTVGWQIYRRLAGDGDGCAYMDIDQVGMCLPACASEPDRHRLQARNLGVMAGNFTDAGARGVIVSGVMDPVSGVDLTELQNTDVVLCRLRADPETLRRRLASRRGSFVRIEDAIAEAGTWDRSRFAGTVVDTTRLTIEQAVHEVLRASAWSLADAPRLPVGLGTGQPRKADGRIVWLCGPSGVGKSTIGFAFFQHLLQRGGAAGYIDADQVGFCQAAPDPHRLKARNVAAIWENFRTAGAETLVVVGPVDDARVADVYEAMLPEASFAWFRLHAGSSELARRIQTRQQGGSWHQPGDPLRGASPEQIQQAATQAAAQAAELDRVGIGVRVDTDHLSVEEAAGAILRRTEGTGSRS